jgi:hypothetical protein
MPWRSSGGAPSSLSGGDQFQCLDKYPTAMASSYLVTMPAADSRPPEKPLNLRTIRWACVVMLAVATFGMIARLQIMHYGLALPLSNNIFFRQYALYEFPFLVLVLTAATAILVSARKQVASSAGRPLSDRWLEPPSDLTLRLLALVVFAVTLVATHLVMHRLLFSMDEFSADFQARIFARFEYRAPVPVGWRPLVHTIIPFFVTYLPESGSWLSPYLPGYALMKAPFVAVGAGVLLNPLLAGGTVLAVGGVARRIWPTDGTRQWLALLLLVTSSQFLVTSATGYSMPAHLCLNMLWLYLYLRGDDRSFAGALLVGGLALSLHQPFPHALFVAPFLVRLLRDRRWGRLAAAALVYGVSAALCLGWMRLAQPLSQVGNAGLLSTFALPGTAILWVNGISLSLLFTWQAPVLGFLVVVAFLHVRQLDHLFADLAWGVVLTLGFYLLYPSTQGHGWGDRYAYQILGNLVLLGTGALPAVRAAFGERHARVVLVTWLGAALLVQIPLRLMQVERFTRPFATGYSFVTTRPARVVLVHGGNVWYGRDIVRNDPFLRGQPVVVRADALAPNQRAQFDRVFPEGVVEISDQELLGLGMTRGARWSY